MGRGVFGGRRLKYRLSLPVRLVLSALLLGTAIWSQFFASHPQHRAANNVGPMLLKVGDCFQRPAGTSLTSVSPVSCAASHTAQLYKLYVPGSFDCFGVALDIGSLPAGTGRALYTFAEQDGSLISACVIVTPPMTGSAMPVTG